MAKTATPAAPVAPARDEDLRVALVEIAKIQLDPKDTDRILEDEAALEELAANIKLRGVMQPVGLAAAKGGGYRAVWGKRRILAAQRAGFKEIPARVTTYASESELLEDRETENLQRKDLNPIEEAAAVARLVDLAKESHGAAPGDLERTVVTIVAARLGKSETWVRDRAFLAQLSGKSRELVLNGRLPLTHAREIAKLADPNLRDQLAKDAASGPRAYGPEREHPMELKELRRLVASNLYSLAQIPWKLDEPFADAPACAACPHNSANAPGLFEHHAEYTKDHKTRVSRWSGTTAGKEPAAGVCTNPSCYKRKAVSAGSAIRAAAKRALKAMTEAGVKTVTPKAVDPHVPPHVERSRVVAAAKDQAETKPASRSGGGAKVKSQAAPKPAAKDGPNKRAVLAWQKANKGLEEKCRNAVLAIAASSPAGAIRVIAAQIPADDDGYRGFHTHVWDERSAEGAATSIRQAEKAVQSSKVRYWIELLARGTDAEAFAVVAAEAKRQMGKRSYHDLHLGGPRQDEVLAGSILKAMGTDAEYRSIEGFLAAELAKVEKAAAKPAGKKAKASGRKKAAGKVVHGVCRVCGCTKDDCSARSECIELTGQPCYWYEPDLCGRCAIEQAYDAPAKAPPKKPAAKKKAARKGGR